jgi:D-gamma-glutamyl-meso-diaminopimelic acid endopeptidase CwlS
VRAICAAFFLICFCPPLQGDVTTNALSHRIQVCEAEVEMLKNSISTQEQSREALEKEVSGLLRATRESLAESKDRSSQHSKTIETTLERLSDDLKQLKTHSNELSHTVNELSKTLQNMKEGSQQQGQAIRELEQAMRSITLAMGGKGNGTSSGKTASYTVKSGDSLEKVARAHGMTLNEIKELNSLKSLTIRPGQELLVRPS